MQLLLDIQAGEVSSRKNGKKSEVVHDENQNLGPAKGEWGLTDEEVVGNIILFMAAGHETTATALTFVLHNLVNDQEAQERLRQEILRHMQESGGRLKYDLVSELPFLDAVVNETLRMYPSVSTFVSRRALADYKHGDINIPAGSHVIIPIWTLQHDPKYWPEPEKFKPERFLPENRSSITPFTFLPFGE